MNKILFYLISICLFSCAQNRELTNDSVNLENNIDTTKVVDVVIDTIQLDTMQIIVNEMKVIRIDEIRDIDTKRQIKLIENHEKKTKLKVVDKSSNVVNNISDTNSGWIAYSVPENMKVAKSYSVKVRISKKTLGQNKAILILGDDDAINNPEYETVATIEDVKVSGEMSAELRGDLESFNIIALSTPTQNLDNQSYTEWEWVVVPKKSGRTPLKLVIKLKELNKDIVVFNKDIIVEKNVGYSVQGFFDKYWQWIMTTIIIPIFLYFWNRKRKKRQTKKS